MVTGKGFARMRSHRTSLLVLALIACWMPNTEVRAEESWPQFRGPGGQGHAAVTGLPTTWSENENIRWKTAVPGLGWSSPVVVGDRIWLTTAVANLVKLKRLTHLNVSQTAVTDAALRSIARLSDLEELNVRGTKISPQALVELRQARPKLHVIE